MQPKSYCNLSKKEPDYNAPGIRRHPARNGLGSSSKSGISVDNRLRESRGPSLYPKKNLASSKKKSEIGRFQNLICSSQPS
jgi:hypothetical protein